MFTVLIFQLTNEQREEMRRYRHCAVMLESKRRVSARQKMLAQLQTTVEDINVSAVCDDRDNYNNNRNNNNQNNQIL